MLPIVVTPPAMAAADPLPKSSTQAGSPGSAGGGEDRCTCMSRPPDRTSAPAASSSLRPRGDPPIWLILPSRTPRSHSAEPPPAVTTVPPRTTRSQSGPGIALTSLSAFAGCRVPRSGSPGGWVPGLVDGELRSVRQADRREQSPALIGDVPCHAGALGRELGQRGVDVVAHQVQLMAGLFGWVDGELGGRQREDGPAAARVDLCHAERVGE